MSVGDGVAIYAALVGSLSLAWQVYRALRSDKPRVVVQLRLSLYEFSGSMYEVRTGIGMAIVVEAVNVGTQAVEVRSAGLLKQDGSGVFIAPAGIAYDSIPGTVEPHHAVTKWFDLDAVKGAGFDIGRPLVGYVNLVRGEARSEPTRLRSI